jgi:4-hydroxy-4-methyl-2-oxoglutarate aldolase
MTDASNDLLIRLRRLSSSAVADAQGGAGTVGHGLSRMSGQGTVAGRAVTARCAEGSVLAVFAALQAAREGDVLVVAAPGDTAYLGDLAAAECARCGISAVVIQAFVRDREALARSPVSFFARGFTPAALRRREAGEAMASVTLGSTIVSPGDWIVADDDGAVCVAKASVTEVIARAEAVVAIEERVRRHIENGMPLPEAFAAAEKESRGH